MQNSENGWVKFAHTARTTAVLKTFKDIPDLVITCSDIFKAQIPKHIDKVSQKQSWPLNRDSAIYCYPSVSIQLTMRPAYAVKAQKKSRVSWREMLRVWRMLVNTILIQGAFQIRCCNNVANSRNPATQQSFWLHKVYFDLALTFFWTRGIQSLQGWQVLAKPLRESCSSHSP